MGDRQLCGQHGHGDYSRSLACGEDNMARQLLFMHSGCELVTWQTIACVVARGVVGCEGLRETCTCCWQEGASVQACCKLLQFVRCDSGALHLVGGGVLQLISVGTTMCRSVCMGMEQARGGVKLVGETSGRWWRSAARRAVHGVLSGEEKSG